MLKIFSKAQAETGARLAKDLGETRDDCRKKTREFHALRGKVRKLEEGLETLLYAPKANDKMIQRLVLQ